MSIFRVISLIVIIFFSPLSVQSEVHYIGLGRDCQVAGVLINFNLRKAAYPLDWMVSHNFYGVIEVFKTDFKYFLDPEFLAYRVNYVENMYYQFGYNHFFPLIGQPVTEEVHVAGVVVPNYLDYLPFVQEVQNRRIQRLLNLVSSNEKIVFIRTHSTPDEAKAFMDMMKDKYPQLDFLLAVVHERADLIGDWHIPNVLNFYASQRNGFADWWTLDEWVGIFLQIQHYIAIQENS